MLRTHADRYGLITFVITFTRQDFHALTEEGLECSCQRMFAAPVVSDRRAAGWLAVTALWRAGLSADASPWTASSTRAARSGCGCR